MTMEEKIKNAVEAAMDVHEMQLVNESHKHAGHAGDDGTGQTHFKLMVVSPVFEGHNRVQRQRLINAALSKCFEEGLHAISLKLLTLDESDI